MLANDELDCLEKRGVVQMLFVKVDDTRLELRY